MSNIKVHSLPPTTDEVYVFARMSAFVCLSSVWSRPPSFGGEITTAGGVDDRAPKARGRDAEGVEGVGNGEGVSPSPAD